MQADLYAIAEALFATEEGPPPRERLQWVASDVDDLLLHAGTRSRLVFRLSLLAVCVLAPLLALRLRPLRAMSLGDRSEALDRLERSALSLPLLAVKILLCLVHYEHPDAAREVGFDGACLGRRHLELAR